MFLSLESQDIYPSPNSKTTRFNLHAIRATVNKKINW